MEVFKVVSDALEELSDRLNDVVIVEDFSLKMSTSTDPSQNVDLHVTLHPERGDEFVVSFE